MMVYIKYYIESWHNDTFTYELDTDRVATLFDLSINVHEYVTTITASFLTIIPACGTFAFESV